MRDFFLGAFLRFPFTLKLRFFVLAGLLAWDVGGVFAQSTQGAAAAGQAATIKVETTLVMIPTVVTDKAGRRISDLKEEDFEVLRDGKVQKIGLFRHVETKAEVMKPTAAPANAVTNAVESSSGRLTIFVIDFLNSTFTEQKTAREQMLKFLAKTLEVREPVSLLALDQTGVKVIHDFTTDPGVLAEALKKVIERPTSMDRPEKNPMEEMYRTVHGFNSKSASRNAAMAQSRLNFLETTENFQALGSQQQVAVTLEALRQIGEAFSGIPGRKSMVWATGGFPFEIDDAARFGLRDRGLLPAYERAWRALNRANIAVYPLDVEQLLNPGYVNPGIGQALPQHLRVETKTANMEKFAEVTGGKFCDRREDAESCFQEAASDSSDYYLIGIYENSGDTKPGWKKLSVRVRQTGLTVRARTGYYVAAPQELKQQIQEELQQALTSPVDYTALPLAVRWTPAKEAGGNGKKKIEFLFALGPGIAELDETENNHLSLEFAALARDAQGLPKGTFSQTVEGHLAKAMADGIKKNGVTFPGTMELEPGDYVVTFAVRDNLKRETGSAITEIIVP